MGDDATDLPFEGFELPSQNWFRMPNSWTDITRNISSLAELKVVEYVLRHTWGYRAFGIAKRISINEFMNGRCRGDGSRIDRGTGLSNRSVIDGLRSAVKHGYLLEEVDASDRGRVKKHYLLRMRPGSAPLVPEDGESSAGLLSGSQSGYLKNLQSGVKNLHRGVKDLHGGSEESSQRSEKDTQERNLTVTTDGNGQSNGSWIGRLPRLGLNPEHIDTLVGDMIEQFGDASSLRFYRLVANRVPEGKIREVRSSIRQDDAIRNPAGVFVYRLNAWASRSLSQRKRSTIDERKRLIGSGGQRQEAP